MKKLLILVAVALPAVAQQTFDFKTLDKLGANAKGSTNISLDSNMLKMAGGLLGKDKDKDSVKAIVNNLKSVEIRSYEFDGPGKYSEADLEALRAYLKAQKWNKIVDVRDTGETSQVYLLPLPNNQLGGVAVISTEPAEVTVVFIDGVLNRDDLGKLSGNLGIPDITLNHGGKKEE